MKKIYTILAAVLLTASIMAQVPQSFKYQAVLRDGSGIVKASTAVSIDLSILQGSTSGTVVYSETHSATTNAYGLVNLDLGRGTPTTGTFANIDWSTGIYFVKVAVDGVDMGTSQLLSVPYALNAKTAESITGTITETDPIYIASQAANITASDITKLSNLSGTNTGDEDLSGLATTLAVTTSLNLKVDKEAGKGLSTNDYTTAEQTKVSNLSGTNTGDNAVNSLYSALVTNATHTGDVTGSGALTITNKVTMTATAPVSVSGSPTVIAASPVVISITAATTSAAGSMSAADKTKLDGIATDAEVNVNADWDASSGDAQILNKPTIPTAADGSETKVTAGSNVTITGAGTTDSPYTVNSSAGGFTHYIGELYQGGIIVAVWKQAGVEKGLIAALTNQNLGTQWSNINNTLIGGAAQSQFDGKTNSTAIIAQAGHVASAASICVAVTDGGYSDWYLPATWELDQCFYAAFVVNTILGGTNGFVAGYYWTSTENTFSSANYKNFVTGASSNSAKNTGTVKVRAVRRF